MQMGAARPVKGFAYPAEPIFRQRECGQISGGGIMKIDLTDEQEMLRSTTAELTKLACRPERLRSLTEGGQDFDRRDWAAGATLAWPGMMLPETVGGAGSWGGATTAAIVGEELGAALHPGPYVEVSVVGDALARVGTPDQRQAFLPGLASGTAVATWAVADDPWSWDGSGRLTRAEPDGTGWTVSGRKLAVVHAAIADHVLLSAASPAGPLQLLVPASLPGLTVEPQRGLDLTRPVAEVCLDQVHVEHTDVVGEPGDGGPIERQLQLACVLNSVDTVGATQRFFEATVDYARDRVAFGRPIGSFQAIKHQLADGRTWLEASQAAAWRAVAALDVDDGEAVEMVSVAKAFISHHCPRIVQMCMQVHGGIAMTWDHPAHHYLRRVRTNAALYGSAAWHRDRVCALAGMGAGHGRC
jgi:alkylation response protein AidB-like acyl-CoA dehydrogenase